MSPSAPREYVLPLAKFADEREPPVPSLGSSGRRAIVVDVVADALLRGLLARRAREAAITSTEPPT